ncbi:MAG: LptA/OstA family protein [Pseudomonadota bacterium]
MSLIRFAAIFALCALPYIPALAQGASVAVGTLQQDTSLPVEVTSDDLSIDNTAGVAVFEGNVIVIQGIMRLTAPRIRVEYDTSEEGNNDITEMYATGGVTFVNGPEAAESDEARYLPNTGDLIMTGDVLLTQGPSVMSGEKLTVDLNAGTGVMEGRVRTVFQSEQN